MLETFRVRFRDLVEAHKSLRQELEECKQEADAILRMKNLEVERLEAGLKAAEGRYENLKMAQSITAGDGYSGETRRKLKGLVRKIDKCISLLNQ